MFLPFVDDEANHVDYVDLNLLQKGIDSECKQSQMLKKRFLLATSGIISVAQNSLQHLDFDGSL